MQNLGLWGHVSHLLQKQHETYMSIYIYIYKCLCVHENMYMRNVRFCIYIYIYGER